MPQPPPNPCLAEGIDREGPRNELTVERRAPSSGVDSIHCQGVVTRASPDELRQPREPRAARPAKSNGAPLQPRRATSSAVSGRGPTALMWPRRMLTNCGNSSRPVARSSRPTRVTRPARIDRNFRMWNGRRWYPTRFCRKTTGRPSSINTATAITVIAGANTTSPAKAPTRSNVRRARDMSSHSILQSNLWWSSSSA